MYKKIDYKFYVIIIISVIIYSVTFCQAYETHIFFGKRSIPSKYLEGQVNRDGFIDVGRYYIKIGDNYIVAGEYAHKTDVLFSGDEVKHTSQGVWLSSKKNLLGGGRGSISIQYRAGLGTVFVNYKDYSAIPPSNGCEVKTVFSALKNQYEMGGKSKFYRKDVLQEFKPILSGGIMGTHATIKFNAWGYDEFLVKYITLSTNYDYSIEYNELIKYNAREGKAGDIFYTPRDFESSAMFKKWVLDPLKKKYKKKYKKKNTRNFSRKLSSSNKSSSAKYEKINTYYKLSSAEKFMELVQSKTDLKLTIIKKGTGYDVMAVVENITVEEIYSKVEGVTGIRLKRANE